MSTRDYNKEFQDNAHRSYFYDFDSRLRRYMLDSFGPWLAEGPTLEMGCFEGAFTALFAERFADLTVIEAASDLIEVTRNKVGSGVSFVCSTFEEAELPPRFANIFLIHTLEHLDDRQAVLKRIHSWLAPGGRLFIAVPNANAPSRQIAVKMGLIEHNSAVTEGERLHGHRVTYTLDTLDHEVRSAGWRVSQRGGVFFKPLANFQLDKALETQLIDDRFMDACHALGMVYPDLCASVFVICEQPSSPKATV
ncbi:methyltransferase domain-containing protein [Pseudomonas mediterranea]|uniref:Methyltransferase domain-containing protein n=1 Tax=Pseudomonas mediterranea TaxID=183795 RepID=A0AAX2DHD2_9PSED|nr:MULTISPECIES: class I SAM-dependent methyltransferase [Pseudomonas]KGU84416.1 methyltransferase type 12 [Pseudomonas mediterranea CFBP 5447]MBL0843514.1 class I SAM-dependent methyltransferase [Pseudomonas mediterranea]MDU9029369.1 class I SAM-dependent methyltransferase [Pseudomonas mediterranea]QHA81588.1 methyltransferase domain-containing protein [Pseudomonas mediterranea]UZE02528.1 class I SAM-dependent methyltransferase [Pseudomonas mediterranea]